MPWLLSKEEIGEEERALQHELQETEEGKADKFTRKVGESYRPFDLKRYQREYGLDSNVWEMKPVIDAKVGTSPRAFPVNLCASVYNAHNSHHAQAELVEKLRATLPPTRERVEPPTREGV